MKEVSKKKRTGKMKVELIATIVLLGFATGRAGGNEIKCECGAFKAPMPEKTRETPLIGKAPNFPISCDSDGVETCAKMCVALAEASRDKAPALLCQVLGDTTEPFTPLIYSRACGDEEWTRTGLSTSHVQICCGSRLPIDCLPPSPEFQRRYMI